MLLCSTGDGVFCCSPLRRLPILPLQSRIPPLLYDNEECVFFLNTLSFYRDISTRCRNKAPLSQDGEWAPVSYGIIKYAKVFRKTSIQSVIERYLSGTLLYSMRLPEGRTTGDNKKAGFYRPPGSAPGSG